MAKKKKGINKLYLIGGAGGTVAAVLIAVFVFGIGAGVLPFLPASAYDIENFPSIDQATELNNAQLREQAEAVFLENPCPDITNEEFVNAAPELPDECNQQEKEAKDILDMQTPIDNSTLPTNHTSTDPPPEQLCDIDPDSILCQILNPSTSTLNLLTTITKIDSAGNSEIIETSFAVPQLSFFVEDISNIDYSTGFIETGLALSSNFQEENFVGTGEMNYLVRETIIDLSGNQLVKENILETAQISVTGISDTENLIPIFFVSSSGATSPLFTFSFAEHFSAFENEKVTDLIIKIKNLDVTTEATFSCIPEDPCVIPTNEFSITEFDIFKMAIARDDEAIIITDEEGILTRVYPTDSRFVLTSIPSTAKGTLCYIYLVIDNGNSNIANPPIRGLRGGTFGAHPDSCLGGNPFCPDGAGTCGRPDFPIGPLTGPTGSSFGTAPPPLIAGIIIVDQDGRIVETAVGGGGTGTKSIKIADILLTRNQNYGIQISVPEITSELSYGKSQETQSFTCQYNPIPKYGTSSTIVIPRSAGCFSGCQTSAYQVLTNNGFINGALSCTLP